MAIIQSCSIILVLDLGSFALFKPRKTIKAISPRIEYQVKYAPPGYNLATKIVLSNELAKKNPITRGNNWNAFGLLSLNKYHPAKRYTRQINKVIILKNLRASCIGAIIAVTVATVNKESSIFLIS